jgi:hypothetical protein
MAVQNRWAMKGEFQRFPAYVPQKCHSENCVSSFPIPCSKASSEMRMSTAYRWRLSSSPSSFVAGPGSTTAPEQAAHECAAERPVRDGEALARIRVGSLVPRQS